MGFFDLLKRGLSKTKDALVGKIDSLFKKFRRVDEDLFDELEELLISADIGVNTTMEILDTLREDAIDNKIKVKLSFKPTFSLSSFTFIKRPFSSSSLSAIRVVSSTYLRLLIFFPGNLDSHLCFFQHSISHDVLCI